MSNRKFRRSILRGGNTSGKKRVLGVDASLRHLYCEGEYRAEQPYHPVIETLVTNGLVDRTEDSVLRLTVKGIAYVAKKHPSLRMGYDVWLEVEEENVRLWAAESGADREGDYDFETLCKDVYEQYRGGGNAIM